MNNTSDKIVMGAAVGAGIFVVAILFVLFALYGAWAAAFVGVKLWAWFVVPVFGLPLLTLPQAFGLSLLCHYWTWQHISIKCKDERPVAEKIAEVAGLLIAPWFTLLLAWICKAYFLGA